MQELARARKELKRKHPPLIHTLSYKLIYQLSCTTPNTVIYCICDICSHCLSRMTTYNIQALTCSNGYFDQHVRPPNVSCDAVSCDAMYACAFFPPQIARRPSTRVASRTRPAAPCSRLSRPTPPVSRRTPAGHAGSRSPSRGPVNAFLCHPSPGVTTVGCCCGDVRRFHPSYVGTAPSPYRVSTPVFIRRRARVPASLVRFCQTGSH